MKTQPFGLDIGVITMKAVWLSEKKKDYYSLDAIVQAQTPAKGMLSESPFDQEIMAQAIKQMVVSGKITTPYVNIALPDSQVYTRVIEMPTLADSELASAIYWNAEQYIPLPLNTVTLDWSILEKPDNPSGGEKMQILLVGAPTILLNKYQKVLTMAGLTINVVETEILATIRSLLSDNMPSSIIVHIGDLSTSFAIIKNGTIVFSYSVATGGIALTRVIASDFGVSIVQAEEYKNAYGIMQQQGTGGKIGKSAEPILMSIVAEIKKALAFYAEKYGTNALIQQIILSGADARLPGIDLFFAQNCGIETVIANPFQQLHVDSRTVPKEILDKASNFTISFGLSMRNYE